MAVLASIVHTRLLPGVADHGQHKAGELLEESAQHVVNGILEAGGEDAAAGGELNYFAPLEYKYLGSHRCPAAEVSGHMSFKYIGSRPEFIQRERSAQKALAQDTKRGTSVLSSRVSTTKLFAQDRPDPDGGSLRRASGGLLPLKPLYKPSVEHKAPIMLPFSQV